MNDLLDQADALIIADAEDLLQHPRSIRSAP